MQSSPMVLHRVWPKELTIYPTTQNHPQTSIWRPWKDLTKTRTKVNSEIYPFWVRTNLKMVRFKWGSGRVDYAMAVANSIGRMVHFMMDIGGITLPTVRAG